MDWQLPPKLEIPAEIITALRNIKPQIDGKYAAQLLWQRGIQDMATLPGYLDCDRYLPTSPFAFGQEMELAVERLKLACDRQEKVAIWGDFDADGITATSVLNDGLGQFLGDRLSYYIPNRATESHGLNIPGIDRLYLEGIRLIITCDTGSTNLREIEYAQTLGLDIIVTDHHTLPPDRPPVIAIINPRYLADTHPLFHLSGVAVAYKLVEALYLTLPDIPQQPLDYLLDLVAIGLIADLVQLSGECRYLAQRGLKRLAAQNQTDIEGFRPGVHKLLQLCKKTGDRPFDVSFGIAPRINAISRIHGDASFGVELLTNRDRLRTEELAAETELANSRRKELQKNTSTSVRKKLAELDLSTLSVIILCDSDWSGGVLGLVAGEIAQELGKPTILLTTAGDDRGLARGSARSTQNIDLYQLVLSQSHLLQSFGGHPFAAGMSIKTENIPIFSAAINQQLLCTIGELPPPKVITDLQITVAELCISDGRALFEELLLLEPYGMGNSVPKLLIKNCRFDRVFNKNIQDFKGKSIRYIRTSFEIADATSDRTFPGIWWGHYANELPTNITCDAIVELDYNAYSKRCELRLLEVRPAPVARMDVDPISYRLEIVDLRDRMEGIDRSKIESAVWVKECPRNWPQIQAYCQQAIQTQRKLALDYQDISSNGDRSDLELAIGVAKYLASTGVSIDRERIAHKLNIGYRTLQLWTIAIAELGFKPIEQDGTISIGFTPQIVEQIDRLPGVQRYLAAVEEERFNQTYFLHVPIYTISAMASLEESIILPKFHDDRR
jgi:single-stranded-DNA-specific exonuclease